MLPDRRRDFFAPLLPAPDPRKSLLDRFNHDYICIPADQPELLRRALETRYRVYCIENTFENPDEHGDGLESDSFDERSSHCILVSRNSGDTIGTTRLILPVPGLPLSFSLRNIIDICGESPTPAHATAEVSRFSISKSARGAAREYPAGLAALPAPSRAAEPLPSLGLIQGLVRMSVRHGISHWCAVMEPKLLRMLAAMGIHFTPVGPMINYHGLRQLSYCELGAMLRRVRRERPSFWDVITDGGKLV